MIKTILVTLDGSRAAETVLPYAESVASRTGATLHLLTVVREEPAGSQAITYLSEKADELRSRSLSCTTEVVSGDEAEVILAEAEAQDADLIAISTHGRSGLRRWILGSVAHKLLHGTSRPLLLVRGEEQEERRPPQIERILVPLDGSPLSLSILPYVEHLAEALSASLVVYNAVPPLDPSFASKVSPAPVGSAIDAMLDQGRSFAAWVAGEIEARGRVKAQSLVTIGFPVREIVQVSQDVNAGLIALATHGRSGLDSWVVGSVADGVVRRSGLPCLVVRPEAAAEEGQ